MSIPAFAKIKPEIPPIVNNAMNPTAKTIGVSNFIKPPHIVATQEKILIAVGTAIIIVAAVK
jgi:hypothetical protein